MRKSLKDWPSRVSLLCWGQETLWSFFLKKDSSLDSPCGEIKESVQSFTFLWFCPYPSLVIYDFLNAKSRKYFSILILWTYLTTSDSLNSNHDSCSSLDFCDPIIPLSAGCPPPSVMSPSGGLSWQLSSDSGLGSQGCVPS